MLLTLTGSVACANPTPAGGSYYTHVGSQGCLQMDPSVTPGTQSHDSGNPYPDWYWSGQGNVSTPIVSAYYGVLSSSFLDMRGNMDTIAKMGDPCSSPNMFIALNCYNSTNCYSSAVANVLPAVAIFNMQTGAFTGPTTIASDTAAGAQPHDSPSIVGTVTPGCAFVGYGSYSAASPGVAAWSAFNSAGIAGSSYYAQPVIFGCNLNASTDPASFLNSSNKGFLPTTGLSEMTSAQNGTSAGNIIMACGQVQKGTTFGVTGGQLGCIVGRIVDNNGTINSVQWDTQCGPQASSTAHGSICNGVYVLSDLPYSDQFDYIPMSTIPTTGSLTFNTNGVTACSSALSVTAGASAAATLANLALAYNGSAGTTAGCPNTTYKAYAATTTNFGCTATACLAFGYENGDPAGQTVPTTATCTTITCGTPARISGNTQMFTWGGVRYNAGYFWIAGDVQQDTATVLGNGQNNYPFAFWGMRVQILPGGIEYCDYAGNNCRDLTLTTTAQTTYHLLGIGGGGSCTATADCTEPGAPTVATWCTASPAGYGGGCTDSGHVSPFLFRPCSSFPTNFPTLSGSHPPFAYSWDVGTQSSVVNIQPLSASSGKDLMFSPNTVHLVWGGQDLSGGVGDMSIFDIQVGLPSKNTTCVTAFRNTTAANLQAITVSGATGQSGKLYITGVFGNGASTLGCTAFTGTCVLQTSSTNNGASWGTASVVRNGLTGHASTSAAMGNVFDTEDGIHVWDILLPGACTQGACGVYLTDHVIP